MTIHAHDSQPGPRPAHPARRLRRLPLRRRRRGGVGEGPADRHRRVVVHLGEHRPAAGVVLDRDHQLHLAAAARGRAPRHQRAGRPPRRGLPPARRPARGALRRPAVPGHRERRGAARRGRRDLRLLGARGGRRRRPRDRAARGARGRRRRRRAPAGLPPLGLRQAAPRRPRPGPPRRPDQRRRGRPWRRGGRLRRTPRKEDAA